VAWVEANTHKIIEVSKDPINNRWWAEAEDQWQFLAFCFEWSDMVLNYGGDTRQFPSHLSIQLDGTCNGLQNFSALLRDEDGGKATNLVPQDTPSDIYQEVADVLIEMVGEDARKGIDEAKIWNGKITRKVVKRGVMTTPYGAKKYGLKSQLKEELHKIDTTISG
jgi:DNA-directed RNA polymerase